MNPLSEIITTEINFDKFSNKLEQENLDKYLQTCLKEKGILDFNSLSNSLLIFNFSKTDSHYDLGALLWLIVVLNKLRKQGNNIKLIFPEPGTQNGDRIWSFLTRWRFFNALEKCVDDPVNLLAPNQIQYINRTGIYKKSGMWEEVDKNGVIHLRHTDRLLEIATLRPDFIGGWNDTIDNYLQLYYSDVLKQIFGKYCGWPEKITDDFVIKIIKEGLDNSFIHSRNDFTNISLSIDKENVIFSISDNGIGIPESLRLRYRLTGVNDTLANEKDDDKLLMHFTKQEMIKETFLMQEKFNNDSNLINEATKLGVGAKDRRGVGLFEMKMFILKSNGQLRIRSGKAMVDFYLTEIKKDPKEKFYDDLLESPGTMIRAIIPIIKPQQTKS